MPLSTGVLNARPGVRDKTILAVNDAIDGLGYVRNVAAANLTRQRTYRFLIILPSLEGHEQVRITILSRQNPTRSTP